MKRIVIAIAVSATFVGCSTERDLNGMNYDGQMEAIDIEDLPGGAVDPGSAWLAGDIGPLRAIDHVAMAESVNDVDYTHVMVMAEENRGMGMHLIDFYGSINHPAIRPGASFTFADGEVRDSAQELKVAVMVCQGESASAVQYDEPAGMVYMDVSDIPGNEEQMHVDVTTQVETLYGIDESTTSFNVMRPEEIE